MLRSHQWFFVLLTIALAVRIATWIAYAPALMLFTDSWGYLSLSQDFSVANHVVLAPDRPFGYPLLLWLFGQVGGKPGLVTFIQHVVGLATGTIAYVALVRLNVRHWIALAAAAIVLLDTYGIAMEETLLPEPWFMLLLVGASFLIAACRPSPWVLLGSGLLLGMSASLRLVALTVIPIWGVYLLWRHWHRPQLIAIALLGLAIPIAAYATAYHAETGKFGFSNASGIFLYGRVAGIADCTEMDISAKQRALCEPASERQDNPGFYIWNPKSPARKLFPGWGATPQEQAAEDAVIGDFAREAIRARPFAYFKLVGRDFGRFFVPGIEPWSKDPALSLPASLPPKPSSLSRGVWPDYTNEARFPSSFLHFLWRFLRTPRWLLGGLIVLVLCLTGSVLARRVRGRSFSTHHQPEMLLFVGMALATLVATAATANFALRYVVAVAPLILMAGALGIEGAVNMLHRDVASQPFSDPSRRSGLDGQRFHSVTAMRPRIEE